MTTNIDKLFNFGIINKKPVFIKLQLSFLKHFFFKLFHAFDVLLHCHGSNQNTGFAFNEGLNEIFDMLEFLS